VPQHMWLWSAQDELACHKRRYTRQEMVGKLISCGFTIRNVTSFVFMLLPFMYLSRAKKTKESDLEEFKISKPLNKFLTWAMKLDEIFIKLGISLPVGGSLFCVVQKK
ncbi:MAG: class I SAM-dependent methyltransferase, partial [Thermodesulfobium sp.]